MRVPLAEWMLLPHACRWRHGVLQHLAAGVEAHLGRARQACHRWAGLAAALVLAASSISRSVWTYNLWVRMLQWNCIHLTSLVNPQAWQLARKRGETS